MIILHFYYLFANLPPHFIYDLGHDFTHPCNKNTQNLKQDQQFTFLFGRLARASLEWVKTEIPFMVFYENQVELTIFEKYHDNDAYDLHPWV